MYNSGSRLAHRLFVSQEDIELPFMHAFHHWTSWRIFIHGAYKRISVIHQSGNGVPEIAVVRLSRHVLVWWREATGAVFA